MDTDNRSDAEIIKASLDDLAAFGLIIERHHDAVFRYVARRMYRRRDEVPDLTSDVFLRAIKLRHRFDTTQDTALKWLYAIAHNIVRDRIRRIGRGGRAHQAIPKSVPSDDAYQAADSRVVAESAARIIEPILDQLSASERETLFLSAYEGLTYAEIGEIQGISPKTVGSRLTRIRQRIREEVPDLGQKSDRLDLESDEDHE